jgi:ribosomal peptide maturation radical SAM protein 1
MIPHPCEIAFVNMPFAHLDGPALGISILQSILQNEGHQVDTIYLNLVLAELLGTEIYCGLFNYDLKNPESRDHIPFDALAGEWAFSQNYYGDTSSADDTFLSLLRRSPWRLSGRAVEAVRTIKAEVPTFLQECFIRFDWAKYDVVGFTSTFEQTMPSLLFARTLKQKFPRLKIIFGGANCEAGMGVELLRQYDFIDCVCLGEGEPVISSIIESLTSGKYLKPLPNVAFRQSGTIVEGLQTKSSFSFQDTFIPNFDDYFTQLRSSPLSSEIKPWIHMESSRGCWWGMKQHCTFCGLNGNNMSFRSKKPEHVVSEMLHHSSKYNVRDFAFVDNILDMSYFQSLLPELSSLPQKFRIWFEVKSNLRKDQIKLLSEAGFCDVQPGIESFSTKILAQMRKGVTAIQNVAFLKWAKQFGVRAWWNILFGFPNEDEHEYLTQLDTLKRIVHFQRPSTICQIRMDRFSPNHSRSKELGFSNVRPLLPYQYVFPFSDEVLSRLCYFFDFDYPDGRNPQSYTRELRRFWLSWLHHPSPGELNLIPLANGGALIKDTRFTKKHSKFRLDAVQRFLYESCDSPNTIEKALVKLRGKFVHRSFDEAAVRRFFDYMESEYLMLREEDKYLALALPLENGFRSDPIS